MKLLDVNVLLPAYRDDHPDHAEARAWLDTLLAGEEQFGVPWTVWWSFLRLATHPRIFPEPSPRDEALEFVQAVRGQPGHVPVEPEQRHPNCLARTCALGEVGGDLVPDAALAALALEHACTVVSYDRDFARFPNIHWTTPHA